MSYQGEEYNNWQISAVLEEARGQQGSVVCISGTRINEVFHRQKPHRVWQEREHRGSLMLSPRQLAGRYFSKAFSKHPMSIILLMATSNAIVWMPKHRSSNRITIYELTAELGVVHLE